MITTAYSRCTPVRKAGLLLTLVFGLASCSAWEWTKTTLGGAEEAEGAQAAADEQEAAGADQPGKAEQQLAHRAETPGTGTPAQLSSVEILWQAPGEAVEKYHLRFGLDPAKLDNTREVAVNELEKLDHPVHGPLYRYVLRGVKADKKIYFTIQAENQFGRSPESPVQEIR